MASLSMWPEGAPEAGGAVRWGLVPGGSCMDGHYVGLPVRASGQGNGPDDTRDCCRSQDV